MSDWLLSNLSEVAEIGAGNSAPQAKELFYNGSYPFFRTADAGRIKFGIITQSTDYLNELGIKRLRKFPKGTILFPKSGASTFLNHRVMLGIDGFVSSHLATIIPNKAIIDEKFLLYYLSTIYSQNLVQDHSYPSLNRSNISGIRVSYPSLPEQRRIVAILDEAFAGLETMKANAEKNLINSKNILEQFVSHKLTDPSNIWENNRLKNVCEKITDGTHQTPKYFEQGYIFLSSRNVTSGFIDWDRIKYIDKAQHEIMQKRVSPKLGDILLAKNGTTGVAAQVDRDVPFDIYVSLALLRCKNIILPEFLLNFVNSPVAKAQFNKRLKGIGVPNLHLEEIREVEISYPIDIRNQKEIVNELNNFRELSARMKDIYDKKLKLIEELKQSILHKAFSGELTSSDVAA